jgi:hypothetical protein
MKAKQLIILFLLFITSLLVAVFVGKKSESQNVVLPPLLPSLKPAGPSVAFPSPFSKLPQNYSFSSLASETKTAYSFSVSGTNTNDVVSRVAKHLGFIGDPTLTQSTRGDFLRWSGPRGSLTFVPDRKTIVFSSSAVVSVSKKPTPTGQLVVMATNYLSLLSLPNIPENIAVIGTEYFAPQNNDPHKLPSSEGATVTQVNFEYQLNGVPVYSEKLGSTSDIWVRLDTEGNVLSFSVVPLPDLVQGERIPVIPIEEAANKLMENKVPATNVVWSEAGDALVYLEGPPVSIFISSGILTYYYNSQSSRIDPVYVFTGEGVVSNRKVKTVSAISAAE